MSKNNSFKFAASLHIKDVRQIVFEIDQLIEFRGYDEIDLDFSDTEVLFADTVASLVTYFYSKVQESIKFNITMPKDQKLNRLFINCGWAHFISPKTYPEGKDVYGNLCLRRFIDGSDQTKLVDLAVERALGATDWLSREHLKALEWSIQEITDNVLQHSESPHGGFMQMSIHRNAREIEFIVTDHGIGIPNSLRSGYKPDLNDEESLEHAVREGVTRGTGQGNGLFGTFQISHLSGAPFYLNSGKAFLIRDRGQKTFTRREQYPFPGTSVVCFFNFARRLLLETALTLGGRKFAPRDFIESRYTDTDDFDSLREIVFKVLGQTNSVGSRYAGLECRRKVENLARMSGAERVSIDFSGISIISSSFADEFIAKLIIAAEQGDVNFSVRLKNISPINESIASRSLDQRRRPVGPR
jgi:anti-sigma regulatory factor (Ser/Thr protein kinase)